MDPYIWRNGEPPCPVQRHRRRGGLLQRFVGEEPTRHPGTRAQVVQFRRGPAAQQRRLHQHRRPVTEPRPHRGDIGDPGGVGQLEFSDRSQRRGTRFRPQVPDVGRAEFETSEAAAQDGLTPVIITL